MNNQSMCLGLLKSSFHLHQRAGCPDDLCLYIRGCVVMTTFVYISEDELS